jgi:hypothetical protein
MVHAELGDSGSNFIPKSHLFHNNTVEHVYTDLAKYCVGTPYCMCMLEHAGTTRRISNMPSWVPDWSYDPRYPLDSRLYQCAGDTTANVSLSQNGQKLHLKAITFDKINVLGPGVTYPDFILASTSLGNINNPDLVLIGLEEIAHTMCNQIHAKFGRYPGHGSGEGDLSDIISRPLTADRGFGDRRVTPEGVRFYKAFMSKYPRG